MLSYWGTYCVGTARTNRKHFPVDVILAKDEATSPGNFRFAINTRCTKSTEATTTVSSSVVSSTATVPLEPNSPEVSNKETTESQDIHCAVGQSNDKIIALWWKDRWDVFALTTMHNASAYIIMKERKASHDKVPLPCLTTIIDYNQYMGGINSDYETNLEVVEEGLLAVG